jgi:uncharacterized DUF497 family protein
MSGDDLYEEEEFSWLRHKEASNIAKHDGISFDVVRRGLHERISVGVLESMIL